MDATIRLRLDDPKIHREAALLDEITSGAMRTRANRAQMAPLKKASPLYINYRGNTFPIRTRSNRIPSPWRSLSSWMKLQVAGLCLAEHPYEQFRITPTDELVADLAGRGIDCKAYLRDDLRRRLRRQFPGEPWFFFVAEDLSNDGDPVPTHVHGSVCVTPMPLPRTQKGHVRIRWARISACEGTKAAELAYGRYLLHKLLRRAAGSNSSQRHLWYSKPYQTRSNPGYISYTLKNHTASSGDLPDRRLVISRGLTQEASRLWELLRCGDQALALWDGA